MYVLTERRLALEPFRSHRVLPGVLHWSLNYCLTWPDSIKNNVHEPYQDLGRRLGSRKTGLSPPSNVITNCSKAVLLVRLFLNETRSVHRTLTIIYILYSLVETLGTSEKRYSILKTNRPIKTKFCIHIIIDKIYVGIINHCFSQICNRVTVLD